MEAVREQQYIHCGPVCHGGAAHNARAEDGVPYPAPADVERGNGDSWEHDVHGHECKRCGKHWSDCAADKVCRPTVAPAAAPAEGERDSVHNLKVWPQFFAALENGSKRFELRKNDRDYRVGDVLHLQCFDPEKQDYVREEGDFAPKSLAMLVTYIVSGAFGLPADVCVMSVEPVIAAPQGGMPALDEDSAFLAWWIKDGSYYDPDTEDVPWFDKRRELAAYAWMHAHKSSTAEHQALREERNEIANDSTANAMRVVELERELKELRERVLEEAAIKCEAFNPRRIGGYGGFAGSSHPDNYRLQETTAKTLASAIRALKAADGSVRP